MPSEGGHVVLTCGAGGALNVIMKTLLDPGDEVVIFAPYFVEYMFYADNHGGTCRVAPTDESSDAQSSADAEKDAGPVHGSEASTGRATLRGWRSSRESYLWQAVCSACFWR